ncbi:MAG: aminoacyl--tRNA ligase-related protein [Parcubacteria group bacterium]
MNISNGVKQSQLFTKTQKDAPKDEVSVNAQLLIRAGFINKEMAGVYSYLPLGLRVLNKVADIIREEINKIGGQEMLLTVFQGKETWEKTGRWDDKAVDNWFKTSLKNGTELGLGFTHEEAIAQIMKNYVSSYKDLPIYAYQIQTKFRNEMRAKSGLIRGREFLMKDLYSFHINQEDLDEYYEKAKKTYGKIFNRVGLGEKTYITIASGGSFSKYSHEFQTIAEAGEDLIHICNKCGVAINEEIKGETEACPECKGTDFRKEKAVEVGNIFKLGEKFSVPAGLAVDNKNGEKTPVVMGSYGIGPGRVMGTIVEVFHDEKGIIWPEAVSPFQVHLISLGKNEEAEKIYQDLVKKGIEVLFDDRDETAGKKFADSDLIGIPYRVVVSEKSLQAGGPASNASRSDAGWVEVKKRNEKEGKIVEISEFYKIL